MNRAWLLVVVSACSSREHAATRGSGSAIGAAPAPVVTHAQLPWKALQIDKQDVVELRPQPRRLEGAFASMGGTATTSTGQYDLIWKLDSLQATPGQGRHSVPQGGWTADVQSQGEKFVLAFGSSDAKKSPLEGIHTSDEPIEIIALFGEQQDRVLVFREGARWLFAHTAYAAGGWKLDTLPFQGAAVASALDSEGRELALAGNVGDNGAWLPIQADTYKDPKRAILLKPLPGKITSTCGNEALWVTTDKNTLQRLPNEAALSPGASPTIVACNADAAIVRLADGSAQLCSTACKPTTIPAGEPTVQALIGDDLVTVEQRDPLLAITRHGKRTEYDQGGVIQRMQLLDFGGTPVLVTFGRQSLDPTRWTVIP